jgi:thiol-disulfide isomerase/thioredoxin
MQLRAALFASTLALITLGLTQSDTTSLEGKRAPDLSLNSLDKTRFKLSAHKGNVVLLDYWATWCPPCRESLPHINELAADKALADRGLRVFAINSKEKLPVVQKFMTDNNYTFPVPLDPTGEFGRLYKVRGIPTTVLVGRDGTIEKVFVGFGEGSADQMKKAILAALDKPAPETPSPAPKPAPAPSK